MPAPLILPEEGKLALNIAHFARALRKAGLPVGTGRVLDAIRAVAAAGFTDRRDFYFTLQACFVSRPEHREVFAQVFRLFWRDPQFLERMMALLTPMVRGIDAPKDPQAAERRAAEALLDGAERPAAPRTEADAAEAAIDARLTFSADERLKAMDFAQMTAAEQAAARRAIARLELPVRPIASRRTRVDPRGRVADWRGTMRAALRSGGEVRALVTRARRTRWPNLVVLCDISGSMSDYSRMLLHFLHAAANAKGAGWAQVHAFTFGTRLTNITRHLRRRDVDAALAAAGQEALDWEGGTRIGECLHAFNRDWSRRVLGQGAVVLLITDGLDRGEPGAARRRDRAAASLGAEPRLAEPAAALGRVQRAGARDPRHAAACRRLPRLPQPGRARGPGRRPRAAGGPPRADAAGGDAGRTVRSGR